MNRIITFLTDFGDGSPYVAQMKAVVLGLNPAATLVDITHGISPQNVYHAALVLHDVTPHFPDETIHVCVVDPGVGTARTLVYARLGPQHFLAPDNGLLSLVARRCDVAAGIALHNPQYFRHPVSATFHGRDILAPVAAHLSLGLAPAELGPTHQLQRELAEPAVTRAAGAVTGTVVLVDHFGNLISNITRSLLPPDVPRETLRVTCGNASCAAFVNTYGQVPPQQLVALVGSSDRIEIALTCGNASIALGVTVGAPVQIAWEQP
jgi:hypothetical protein